MAKKEGAKSDNGSGGALERLKSIYQFMTDHGLKTLELEEEDRKVRLVRRGAQPAPSAQLVAAPAGGAPAPAAGAPAPAPSAGGPAGATGVKAPMMGIFYRAPSPSSPPFVKDGETVKPGEVICMIEAMKVFNEIKAEFPESS